MLCFFNISIEFQALITLDNMNRTKQDEVQRAQLNMAHKGHSDILPLEISANLNL